MTAQITPAENGLFLRYGTLDGTLDDTLDGTDNGAINRHRRRHRLTFTEGLRAVFQGVPIKLYQFRRKASENAI